MCCIQRDNSNVSGECLLAPVLDLIYVLVYHPRHFAIHGNFAGPQAAGAREDNLALLAKDVRELVEDLMEQVGSSTDANAGLAELKDVAQKLKVTHRLLKGERQGRRERQTDRLLRGEGEGGRGDGVGARKRNMINAAVT